LLEISTDIVNVIELVFPVDLETIAGVWLEAVNVKDRLEQNLTGILIHNEVVILGDVNSLGLLGELFDCFKELVKIHIFVLDLNSRD